ncbi:MAG TPA: DNA-3-methyladenine glycosylase I [Pseudonocardiaceae bacterium]|nr:DNA-3-methyladenine glycosylase I [Pseudonocardiaceae bacterium]
MSDAVLGADGRARCSWAGSTPDYLAYHDEEWGVRLHGEQALFERLSLEGFQSGLSWITILRKRPAFRQAFADFDPKVVAEFTEVDVERLMADAGIVRNRAKILAAIKNAKAVLALDGGLDDLLWSFAPDDHPAPKNNGEVPPTTAESTAMSKRLKKLGFGFVGPTTCYAMMQATGMVDDHLVDCWRAALNGR